jgi:hypothetical protein
MDLKFAGEHRLSIAGMQSNSGGVIALRAVLLRFLAQTVTVIAMVQRPYSGSATTLSSLANLSPLLARANMDEDFFSLSFAYGVLTNNDAFIDTFVRVWREYEQPYFCFYPSDVPRSRYDEVLNDSTLSWGEKADRLFELSPCFALYRSIEEDVLWIDKSSELSFKNVVPDDFL